MQAPHRQLLLAVSFLFIIGLVMIFNTSSAEVIEHALDMGTRTALIRQLFYGLFGVVLCCSVACVSYTRLVEWAPKIMWGICGLLVLVLIPGIGVKVNGARRWIYVAGLSLQPSEIVKVLLPLSLIEFFSRHDPKKLSWQGFLRLLLRIVPSCLLVAFQPNNATLLVIISGVLVLFFLVKLPLKYWAVPCVCLFFIGSICAYNMPYVVSRIDGYLHPERDLLGKGHQPYQAKVASGSGGLFGKGPGKSMQKLSYLPEAQNDYIAAIFAEEFGFVGVIILLGIYAWLAYLGLFIALSATEEKGYYVAAVSVFLITFQAVLNMGVVSGLLPSTGLNLPFFSQGGSSLIGNSLLIGFLMSVSKRAKKVDLIAV